MPNPRLRAHPVQPLTEAAFLLKGLRLSAMRRLPVDRHNGHAGDYMRGIGAQHGHGAVPGIE